MKAFVLLLILGYFILCIIPKDKNKNRWYNIIELEKLLRKNNQKRAANQYRKLRKKAKNNKNIAKYLDSLEAKLSTAPPPNHHQQIQIDLLQTQVQDLQWKNQQLEWKIRN